MKRWLPSTGFITMMAKQSAIVLSDTYSILLIKKEQSTSADCSFQRSQSWIALLLSWQTIKPLSVEISAYWLSLNNCAHRCAQQCSGAGDAASRQSGGDNSCLCLRRGLSLCYRLRSLWICARGQLVTTCVQTTQVPGEVPPTSTAEPEPWNPYRCSDFSEGCN